MTPASFVILSSQSTLSPIARAWQSAILENGGTASFRDMQPFDRLFIRPSVADGLWDKIIDAAFFVGLTGLNSIMVKVKTAPSVSRILTNIGFVSGDYSISGATAGLKANTGKYLNIGAVPVDVYNTTIAGYFTERSSVAGTLIGSRAVATDRCDLIYTGVQNLCDLPSASVRNFVNTTATGFAGQSSRGVSNREMFVNGSSVNLDTRTYSGGVGGTQNFSIHAYGAGVGQTNGRVTFTVIATATSVAEFSLLATRVNAVMAEFGASKF